jgi:hypothetical protein
VYWPGENGNRGFLLSASHGAGLRRSSFPSIFIGIMRARRTVIVLIPAC